MGPVTKPIKHDRFLEEAIRVARRSVLWDEGGPFGAVVVFDGKVVGRGQNRVTRKRDPTAHAEVVAIRNACQKLNRYELRGAVLYSSCEPCPMCLAAAYWSRLDAIYFGAGRDEAAAAGFDDARLYAEVAKPIAKRTLPMTRLAVPDMLEPFEFWQAKSDRLDY